MPRQPYYNDYERDDRAGYQNPAPPQPYQPPQGPTPAQGPQVASPSGPIGSPGNPYPNDWPTQGPAARDPAAQVAAGAFNPAGYGSPSDYITAYYKKYLGRAPSTTEIASQTGNYTFGLNDPRLVLSGQNIINSPEAYAYAHRQPTTPTTTQGSGDTGYDWLGFAQGLTGGQNVSRGGSQGGFITGGGQYRGHLQPVVDAYNAKYGTHAQAVGDDKIDFGDGRGPQDVITGGGDFWYGGPSGSMQPGGGGGGGGVGGGGGQVGSVGANGLLTGSADAGGSNYLNTFRQAMLGQLQQYQQPTSLTSPTLQPQLTASRIANQRGIERAQKGLAEQAYAGGDLNTNGYGQQQQQLLEHAGQTEAATEGGLVDTAEARRQAMLGQLLGLGSSQGLQQLLANNQLGYNYAALGQQKDLFGDQLGFNYATLQNQMNRDAFLASLGYYDR